MVLDLLVAHPWTIAAIWAAMYIFDYAGTLWLAKAYRTTLSRYVVFEHGIELNPNFENEVAAVSSGTSRVSLKFVFLLCLVVVIVLLSPIISSLLTEFLGGALLLMWSFIASRHLRNYAFVRALQRKPDSLGGRQEQSYWFTQRLLAAEALTFAGLCLLLGLLTFRLFFLGGVVSCLSLGLRALRLANRKFGPQIPTPRDAK